MDNTTPELYSVQPFTPEPWMAAISKEALPTSRVQLASLPTPIHRLRPFTITSQDQEQDETLIGEGGEGGIEIHLKRDDLTSFDLSGNKVRKLEFLLADALQRGFDTVITIGGLQSNHCRATAVAARQLGLTPVLILRTELTVEQISLQGNLLLSRMAGAEIYTVKPEDYYAKGGDFFVHQLAERLNRPPALATGTAAGGREGEGGGGRKCYEIPCGGSNVLGTFGYMHAVTELMQQCGAGEQQQEQQQQQEEEGAKAKKRPFPYDHLVFGCGSGGTAAGLAIGVHLARLDVQVHAVGVCDSPDDFYEVVRHKACALGLHLSPHNPQRQSQSAGSEDNDEGDHDNEEAAGEDGKQQQHPPLFREVRSWLRIHDGQGGGYGVSSPEELAFLHQMSSQTGVLLDPVYSGKALFTLASRLLASLPGVFLPGQRVLFVHTGGALGCYAQEAGLLPLVARK